MNEFGEIANQHINEAFAAMNKATESWTEAERQAYRAKFQPAIWQVAGPDEAHSFPISLN